jgi:hypothetical protein
MGRQVKKMEITELAAPLFVVASGVALGVVGMFFGVDSREGFYEPTAQRPKVRWFIEPRE